ncbi:GNAT family N-acetyltransferase [Bradyrhizobium pachyrhizi]|uniref:GNAT family N-acetyltransferase n=1 Tax=Bradyrhizobium pachyrhizi TaxID=280333 RepID=A0A844SCH7_9BRAD|nr:GNAT family N-acetyltransferase [Bradyrhizobium pachyrhizi]MVT64943.1 GNAT family N-acetyltransferase [Bradyrhizobium pachyrhizi]
MKDIRTSIANAGSLELTICAGWRVNAFSMHRTSFEEELKSLERFASDQSRGVLLVAKTNGEPIGSCLLVESEFEPNHDVAPWLTGLFVVPEHRKEGAGSILVRAVEDQARRRGVSRLHLYTTEAAGFCFYARLGWSIIDCTNWRGCNATLMIRDLRS